MRAALETLRTARELAAMLATLACIAIGAAGALLVPVARALRDGLLVAGILASPFIVCAACDAIGR